MKAPISYEDFCQRAREKHDGKYSYVEGSFTSLSNKIEIICPTHGKFLQKAAKHIYGQGCRECWDEKRKMSWEIFSKKVKENLPDDYSYDESSYISANLPVLVTCPEHGEFWKKGEVLLKGFGCRKCSDEKRFRQRNFDYFLPRALELHGEKYEYVESSYRDLYSPMEIVCATHGAFNQTPYNHLKGKGCGRCNKSNPRVTYDVFLERAVAAHGNKYEYKHESWSGLKYSVIVVCPDHGEYSANAAKHASGGQVCKECGPKPRDYSKKKQEKPKRLRRRNKAVELPKRPEKLRGAPKIMQPKKTRFAPGVNDLETMRPELLSYWSEKNEIKPSEIYYLSNKRVSWECPKGHSWTSILKFQNTINPCLRCVGRTVDTSLHSHSPHLSRELVNYELAHSLSHSSHQQVEWKCERYPHHSHTYFLSPNERHQGRSCPYCALRKLLPGFNDIISVRPDLEKEIVNVEAARSIIANSKEKIEWTHELDGKTHRWKQDVSTRVFSDASCTVCLGFTVQVGVNDFGMFLEQSDLLWGQNDFSRSEVSLGSNEEVELLCPNHEPKVRIKAKCKSFTNGKAGCIDCSPADRYRSVGEEELLHYVQSILREEEKAEANVRRFKKEGVFELDIFVPKLSLALDFNGTYWHQEGKFKPIGFHAAKRAAIAEIGLTYLEVWEDEWKAKKSKVKKRIADAIIAARFDSLLIP